MLDRLAAKMRFWHDLIRTEQAYLDWIKRFIIFHNKRHPQEMGAEQIEAFLTDLAGERAVCASTQNQVFAAILFIYQKVLEIELPRIATMRVRESQRLVRRSLQRQHPYAGFLQLDYDQSAGSECGVC